MVDQVVIAPHPSARSMIKSKTHSVSDPFFKLRSKRKIIFPARAGADHKDHPLLEHPYLPLVRKVFLASRKLAEEGRLPCLSLFPLFSRLLQDLSKYVVVVEYDLGSIEPICVPQCRRDFPSLDAARRCLFIQSDAEIV